MKRSWSAGRSKKLTSSTHKLKKVKKKTIINFDPNSDVAPSYQQVGNAVTIGVILFVILLYLIMASI